MTPAIQPYGPHAHLLTWDTQDPSPIHHLAESLRNHPIIHEITLGYNTLLIQTRHPISQPEIKNILDPILQSPIDQAGPNNPAHHRIETTYNGPDLTEIAANLNLSENEIITRHSNPTYTVRFLGFTPGFPYLDGLHPTLQIPRRPSPRTHIKPGAVAIANGYASIYTIASPGGWNWLGNTHHPIFNPQENNQKAFILKPGDTLQFIPA